MMTPECCGSVMAFLFAGLAFRSFRCSTCGRVIDVFGCCGQIHEIQGGEGAASYQCHGCGRRRSNGDPAVFPNSAGEDELRKIALARVKRARGVAAPAPRPVIEATAPPHVAGSPTSLGAARSLSPEQLEAGREMVRAFLAKRGIFGATDEDMQRTLGMNPNTQRPRRRELELQGLVADSGRKRATVAKRPAVVWVLSEYAQRMGMAG